MSSERRADGDGVCDGATDAARDRMTNMDSDASRVPDGAQHAVASDSGEGQGQFGHRKGNGLSSLPAAPPSGRAGDVHTHGQRKDS